MSTPFVGEIKMFAASFAPRSYALCDGQLLAVSQNDALFSLLGTFYGGDGRTTFGLPDLRGRIPIHQGTGPGLSPRPIGQKAGQEEVTVTVNQLPSHTHALQSTQTGGSSQEPVGRGIAPAGGLADVYAEDEDAVNMNAQSISNKGGNQSHTNIMPFQCINFIIALNGVYPSRS